MCQFCTETSYIMNKLNIFALKRCRKIMLVLIWEAPGRCQTSISLWWLYNSSCTICLRTNINVHTLLYASRLKLEPKTAPAHDPISRYWSAPEEVKFPAWLTRDAYHNYSSTYVGSKNICHPLLSRLEFDDFWHRLANITYSELDFSLGTLLSPPTYTCFMFPSTLSEFTPFRDSVA